MSVEQNKAFIRQYLKALSGKVKPPALINLYVSSLDEDLRQHIAVAEAAFPRYELIAEDMIAEGDKVVVRFSFKGTHAGDFMGVPARGNQFSVPGIIIYRLSGEKIVEHWIHFDTTSLMQQITQPAAVPA